MTKPYFKAHFGVNFTENAKVLILSERAPTVGSEIGIRLRSNIVTPKEIPCQRKIKEFPKRGPFTSMSRAICGAKAPDGNQIKRAWGRLRLHDLRAKHRGRGSWSAGQTPLQWREAREDFLRLNARHLSAQSHRYRFSARGDIICRQPISSAPDGLEAYRLSNGELVWCWRFHTHRTQRRDSDGMKLARKSANLRAAKLPARASSKVQDTPKFGCSTGPS